MRRLKPQICVGHPLTVRSTTWQTPQATMVLEATILCIDNSEYVRNSDYLPTRLQVRNPPFVGPLFCFKASSRPMKRTTFCCFLFPLPSRSPITARSLRVLPADLVLTLPSLPYIYNSIVGGSGRHQPARRREDAVQPRKQRRGAQLGWKGAQGAGHPHGRPRGGSKRSARHIHGGDC